jgi:hypothetical protein
MVSDLYQPMADVITSYGIDINKLAAFLGISVETTIILGSIVLSIIIIWTLIWKGLALWKSVKRNDKAWFIVILIINTVGILEILYIYVFSKMELFNKTDKNKIKSSKKYKKKK